MEQTHPPLTIPATLRGTLSRRPSNLIPALFLLPRKRRRDALLLAEWCRVVDEIADQPKVENSQRKASLETWMEALSPDNEAALPRDFLEMIMRRDLDRELLREIVLGMLMDAGCGRVRIRDAGELELYCRRVASAVGLASARIFGASGTSVEEYATAIGVAMQLTNILRDVAEDAAMDRIYIPDEDLERFDISEKSILSGVSGGDSPAMTHLLAHQAERADSWFAKAELAWSRMTPNQRRLMRPARLMGEIYREILLAMHRDRYDVFSKRYRVQTIRKLALILRVLME